MTTININNLTNIKNKINILINILSTKYFSTNFKINIINYIFLYN